MFPVGPVESDGHCEPFQLIPLHDAPPHIKVAAGILRRRLLRNTYSELSQHQHLEYSSGVGEPSSLKRSIKTSLCLCAEFMAGRRMDSFQFTFRSEKLSTYGPGELMGSPSRLLATLDLL